MIKKAFPGGFLVLFMAAVLIPRTVFAGVDPLASPTPHPTERITAPEIIGINPVVLVSEGNQGETLPSDIYSSYKIHQPELIDLPNYVDLKSLPARESEQGHIHLAVPLRPQTIGSVNCGLAALGMALDYLAGDQEANIPTTSQLSSFLSTRGLVYGWGTGVEELVFAARHFGFPGSYSFQHWNFDQLEAELRREVPVVISLGSKGSGQPGHFVTLTGISAEGDRVLVNDPLKGELRYSKEEFLGLWGLQGNSGMIPVKENLRSEEDFMLPIMGLFSVLSMFGVMYSNRKLAEEPAIIKWIRKELKNPCRKGIGGGPLQPEVRETIKVPRFEYKTIFRGIKNVEQQVPVYKTSKVKVGIRGVKKVVPQYEQKRVQVGFDTIVKDIPIYKKKKVQTGTKLIKKEIPVTRYRTITVTEWKKYTRKLPDYRYIGSKRFLVGYKTETSWKRVPVTKREAYQDTKILTFKEPVYEVQNVLTGYRKEILKVPKYELRKVQVGTKIVKVTEPEFEEQCVQIGTKTVKRQVPDYQVVKVPVLAGGEKPNNYQKDLRLFEKLFEKNDQPTPPTGFSTEIWNSLSDEDQMKIRSDGIEWLETKEKEEKPTTLLEERIGDIDTGFEGDSMGRCYEITDPVYLKGGPGAKSYGLKAEEGWSSHQYGGESTPAMKGLGLLNNILVWIRDNTRIIEKMGGKPNAKAIIFYEKKGSSILIDEIIVKNTGNEDLKVNEVKITLEEEIRGKIVSTRVPIVSPSLPLCSVFDEALIKPNSFSYPMKIDPLEIKVSQTGELFIYFVTPAGRFGYLEHTIKGNNER